MKNTKLLIKAMWSLIAIFILLSTALVYLILNKNQPSSQSNIVMTPITSNEATTPDGDTAQTEQTTSPEDDKENTDETTDQTQSTPTTNPTPTSTNPVTITEDVEEMVQCSGTTTPKTLCEALISIESNGPKNNPYITIPTDNIPSGATIQFEVSSWQKTTTTTGLINAKAKYFGQTINGTLYFGKFDNDWKVNSYTFEGL